MGTYKTKSEQILDSLAEGVSFDELKKEKGYTRKDLLIAALVGVAELHEEYMDLYEKYGQFKQYGSLTDCVS